MKSSNASMEKWVRELRPLTQSVVALAGTSNALDFCIDHEDVAIAVNKDITGNDIPDEVTALGETPLTIHFLETDGGHVGVDVNHGDRFSTATFDGKYYPMSFYFSFKSDHLSELQEIVI